MVNHTFDDVVSAVTTNNGQSFLNIGNQHKCTVIKLEPFDAVFDVFKLSANTQCIVTISDRNHQVIAVFGKRDIVARDIRTKENTVVRFFNASLETILPRRGDLQVNDRVVAVAHIKFVGVTVTAAVKRVITRATVHNFGKVAAI